MTLYCPLDNINRGHVCNQCFKRLCDDPQSSHNARNSLFQQNALIMENPDEASITRCQQPYSGCALTPNSSTNPPLPIIETIYTKGWASSTFAKCYEFIFPSKYTGNTQYLASGLTHSQPQELLVPDWTKLATTLVPKPKGCIIMRLPRFRDTRVATQSVARLESSISFSSTDHSSQ